MFNFHRRCESIEAMLRGRIVDLEEQNQRIWERLEEQSRTHAQREAELLDRYMASTNPQALREMANAARSAQPAAPMPAMARVPQAESPGIRVGGIAPRLTPAQTGFRATASGQPAPRPQTISPATAPAEETE